MLQRPLTEDRHSSDASSSSSPVQVQAQLSQRLRSSLGNALLEEEEGEDLENDHSLDYSSFSSKPTSPGFSSELSRPYDETSTLDTEAVYTTAPDGCWVAKSSRSPTVNRAKVITPDIIHCDNKKSKASEDRNTTPSSLFRRLVKKTSVKDDKSDDLASPSIAAILPNKLKASKTRQSPIMPPKPLETDDIQERLGAYRAALKAHRSRQHEGSSAARNTSPRVTSGNSKVPLRKNHAAYNLGSSIPIQRSSSDATPIINNHSFAMGNASEPIRNVRQEIATPTTRILQVESRTRSVPRNPPLQGPRQQQQPQEEASWCLGDCDDSVTSCDSVGSEGYRNTLVTSRVGGFQAPEDSPDDSTLDDGTLDLDVLSRINASDRELMDRPDSPGALRLTEEGLKQHERKTMMGVDVDEDAKTVEDEGFREWQRRKAERLRCRKKLDERDNHLVDETIRIRQEMDNKLSNKERSSPRKPSVKKLVSSLTNNMSFRKPQEDVTDLSVAPLTGMEGLSIIDQKKKKVLPFFRKRSSVAVTAQTLLEKERLDAVQVRRLRKFQEMQEKRRIEEMRREFLERERLKEASAALGSDKPRLPDKIPEEDHGIEVVATPELRTRSSSSFTPVKSMPLSASPKSQRHSDSDSSDQPVSFSLFSNMNLGSLFVPKDCDSSPAIPEVSTATSSSVSQLPPCVLCHSGERTHIASPCMHYSFCKDCAKRLGRTGAACPVCGEPNVKYAGVSL